MLLQRKENHSGPIKRQILLYDIYNKLRASESIFPLIIAITACTNTCHWISVSSQIELTNAEID